MIATLIATLRCSGKGCLYCVIITFVACGPSMVSASRA